MSPGELLAAENTINEFLDYIRDQLNRKDHLTPAEVVSTMGSMQIYKIGFMAIKEMEAAQEEIILDISRAKDDPS